MTFNTVHAEKIGISEVMGYNWQKKTQQIPIARNPVAGHTQARFGVRRLVAHQAHDAAHPLFVGLVAQQAQVVAQAEYALNVVARKFLVE